MILAWRMGDYCKQWRMAYGLVNLVVSCYSNHMSNSMLISIFGWSSHHFPMVSYDFSYGLSIFSVPILDECPRFPGCHPRHPICRVGRRITRPWRGTSSAWRARRMSAWPWSPSRRRTSQILRGKMAKSQCDYRLQLIFLNIYLYNRCDSIFMRTQLSLSLSLFFFSLSFFLKSLCIYMYMSI